MTGMKFIAFTLVLVLCSVVSTKAQTSTVPDGPNRAVTAAAPQVPVNLSGASDGAIVTVTNTGAPTGGGVGVSGNAPVGYGVQGSGLIGINGIGGSTGVGVSGTSNSGIGVSAFSSTGRGISATGGEFGIFAIGTKSGGIGIRGENSGGIGVQGVGQIGIDGSGGSTGVGVIGSSNGQGTGVSGTSNSGIGVSAYSSTGRGLSATGGEFGIFAIGTKSGSAAIRGEALSGIGVLGVSDSPLVEGVAAVYGVNGKGYAGYFNGPVKVLGLLTLAGGCAGCSPPSDRSLKTNFSAVNPRSILTRLASMPIQSWNYKSEPETTRHIGPMAQDFRAAFGLGTDDKSLNTVDANGVTMAALQGLYQMMQEKDRKIEQLQTRLIQLERRVSRRSRGRGRLKP